MENTPRNTFHVFREQGKLLHFKTCWIISVLFSTKCCLFCNFIFFTANNVFFITHVLKFKCPPCRIEVNGEGRKEAMNFTSLQTFSQYWFQIWSYVMVVDYVYVWLGQSVMLQNFIKEELQIFAETCVLFVKIFLIALSPLAY